MMTIISDLDIENYYVVIIVVLFSIFGLSMFKCFRYKKKKSLEMDESTVSEDIKKLKSNKEGKNKKDPVNKVNEAGCSTQLENEEITKLSNNSKKKRKKKTHKVTQEPESPKDNSTTKKEQNKTDKSAENVKQNIPTAKESPKDNSNTKKEQNKTDKSVGNVKQNILIAQGIEVQTPDPKKTQGNSKKNKDKANKPKLPSSKESSSKRKSLESTEQISSGAVLSPKTGTLPKTKPPPLQNKGEICYMNSIIQALGSCRKMIDDLEALKSVYSSKKLVEFLKLLKALNTTSAQQEFDDFMSAYGWSKPGQQDSFEMLAYFINLIYNELKSEENERHSDMDKQQFNKYWKEKILPCRVNMNSMTKCECVSNNKNILNDLALHLPLVNDGGIHYEILKMIDALLIEDPVDDNCDKCNAKQTLALSLDGAPPRTLCFHIQANKLDYYTGMMIKPEYQLDFPFEMKVKGQLYELVSFVEHLGGVSVGHYLAYRKYDGSWYSLNDTYVDILENVFKPTQYCKKPYVLFYEASKSSTEV